MESLYEYGSRAGFWRVLRLFDGRRMPLTIFGVAMALQRNPEAVAAMQSRPATRSPATGWRWISYQAVDEATEREHIRRPSRRSAS